MLHISGVIDSKLLLKIISIALLALSLCVMPAWADNLEQIRASGAIGESLTGYVVARNPSAQAAANAINAKRRAIYQQKAAAQGVSPEEVGKVYALEIFKTLPAGTWVQKSNGQWIQK